ncbi:hypothetical protein BKA56DRAFT_596784 [Ilyonectria sp. MPI-CAGE-AT-0026]|nr:hypothetical protein BKA56DRAFT_596784 [Ilyonectria sp. MPI-CAGE-AT-0026]
MTIIRCHIEVSCMRHLTMNWEKVNLDCSQAISGTQGDIRNRSRGKPGDRRGQAFASPGLVLLALIHFAG